MLLMYYFRVQCLGFDTITKKLIMLRSFFKRFRLLYELRFISGGRLASLYFLKFCEKGKVNNGQGMDVLPFVSLTSLDNR